MKTSKHKTRKELLFEKQSSDCIILSTRILKLPIDSLLALHYFHIYKDFIEFEVISDESKYPLVPFITIILIAYIF